MSAGVTTAVTPGVPNDYAVKQGVKFRTLNMVAQANRGTVLKFGATAGTVDIATTDTEIAGVLGEDFIDPTSIPAAALAQMWGLGIYQLRAINEPATVWHDAIIYVVNVSGIVADGAFVKGTTGGAWLTNTTTNSITNGAMVALHGNGGVSGAPITVSINLA